MNSDKTNLVNALNAKAREEGFASIAIADARLAPETKTRLENWLTAGCHGDMIWMECRVDERAQPSALWPEVKTVIMLGMSYAPADDPMILAEHPDRARISVYSRGRDYHDVVKGALKRLASWLVHHAGGDVKVFVDTAPVAEKILAAKAGLGWQGKHSNVVSKSHGSWLFLGAIYTTLELQNDDAGRDNCGSCQACHDACPTDAFIAPYQLDARRCISYLTIEHKGPIPHEFRRAMGNHIYGCDDCLAVCPWNKFASAAQANKAFLPRAELVAPRISDLLDLDDSRFRALFSGSPIKRTGRDRFIRNVLIAAGNSGDAALTPKVIHLLDDPNPLVRGAAIWALKQLSPSLFQKIRAEHALAEQDEQVRSEWEISAP